MPTERYETWDIRLEAGRVSCRGPETDFTFPAGDYVASARYLCVRMAMGAEKSTLNNLIVLVPALEIAAWGGKSPSNLIDVQVDLIVEYNRGLVQRL